MQKGNFEFSVMITSLFILCPSRLIQRARAWSNSFVYSLFIILSVDDSVFPFYLSYERRYMSTICLCQNTNKQFYRSQLYVKCLFPPRYVEMFLKTCVLHIICYNMLPLCCIIDEHVNLHSSIVVHSCLTVMLITANKCGKETSFVSY